MNKVHELTQEVVAGFLSRLGQDGEVSIAEKEGVLEINIMPSDPALLIGKHGETLAALQHIIRLILKKPISLLSLEVEPRVMVNIGDWRARQKEALEEMACRAADKVRRFARPEVLRPMTSFERRIIHAALADQEGIMTESMGEAEERRVVVKKRPY